MQEIILGVAMFTLIVVALTVLILFAKSKLVNTGDIHVDVNHDPEKSFDAPAGDKLLNMLSSQGILFLLPVVAVVHVASAVYTLKKVAAIFFPQSWRIFPSVKQKKVVV